MAQKIQIRRGLKANLPLLDVGEFGFTTDTNELFIGSSNGNILFSNRNELSSLIINLKTLGVKSGNSTFAASNSAILKSLITQYPNGEFTFYLPKGEYYFNPIDLTSISGSITIKLKGENDGLSPSWFKSVSTTIKTNKQDFIYDRRNPSPGICFYVEDLKFYSYEGYTEIPTGVCFGAQNDGSAEYNFHFYNVFIHGFDYGFKSPGFSCAGSGGKHMSFSTCHYGIYISSASHLFQADDVELLYNRVGIRFGYGGTPCSISNIHVAIGYLGADKNNFDRFMVIHTKGSVNISNLYQEAYESDAQPEKTTIIDYEGWAFGINPIIIENIPIIAPSGNGGLFLRGRTYLGEGPETGTVNPVEIDSSDINQYPNGCVIFKNCMPPSDFTTLKSLIDINGSDGTGYYFEGMEIYKNGLSLSKDSLYKLRSKFNYVSYNLTSFQNYLMYNFSDLQTPVSDGVAFKDKFVEMASKVIVKGSVYIDAGISTNVKVVLGVIYDYYDDATGGTNNRGVEFSPICTIDTTGGKVFNGGNFYVDASFTKGTNHNYRSQIKLGYKLVDGATSTYKLKSTDFSKITYNVEIRKLLF
ncbi:hypothetical protein V5E38_22245 [Rossellomorea sp. GAMAL-10_SWC]